MNPLLPPHSPEMPEFIFWIVFIAGLIGLACMAWLTFDILEAWQRTRPNQRRKYGTRIKEHKFETSHLDPP